MSFLPILTTSASRKSKRDNQTDGVYTVGQIKELHMRNFMCHQNFSIRFHSSPLQIVTGANGSGKSAIANAIGLCLGAQARTTGRTANVQSFIRKGEKSAQLTLTLANEGPEAFKPEQYGGEIRIVRTIRARQSNYKIMGAKGNVVSTRRETIDEVNQALSISPENPLCILHQEIAKTFLLNSDSKKKYQFYMRVSQLDQIKQAFEDGIYTIAVLIQRMTAMKQKHEEMLRALVPLEEAVKKIHVRREEEGRKNGLEMELISAHADQARQQLLEVQYEFDQGKKNKDYLEIEILQQTNRLARSKHQLDAYLIEKDDLEVDLDSQNGLRDVHVYLSKQKKEIQTKVDATARQCESFLTTISDFEYEQKYLQNQIDKFEDSSKQSDVNEQTQATLEHERSTRERNRQEALDRINSSTAELSITDGHIHDKQRLLDFLHRERQEKQQESKELIQLERDQSSAYGAWMPDCLKTVDDDKRFHKRPIGPIGRFIHCIDPRWSYAVEKHLSSIMSSFICIDSHDEQILIEILSFYSPSTRAPIIIQAFTDHVHDVSGTLKHIQQAGLLSIYQVLRIENMTVTNVLIDSKRIEATVLLTDLAEAKRIRQRGILRWSKINHKVRQVLEAWTLDGSNIRFDRAFRIYTDDKQPLRYFQSTRTSTAEFADAMKQLDRQIQEHNDELTVLREQHRRALEDKQQAELVYVDNTGKLKHLVVEMDRLNSMMPMAVGGTLEEMQEKMRQSIASRTETIEKYERANEEKQLRVGQLVEVIENLDSVMKRTDLKRQECDSLRVKLCDEQSAQCQRQEKLSKLTTKLNLIERRIQQDQRKLARLKKKQSEKSKAVKNPARSVREIQLELDAINIYLKANEDTNEQRRTIINTFRVKRDEAKAYQESYERCLQQIQHLNEFILRRKERFVVIADQHEYLVSHRFRQLMGRYQFVNGDIVIDHKKEELNITMKHHSTRLASLSGGERSISTFCFLLALWESTYQPFRLLDEIDIYMDNERRNSMLGILHKNARQNSSSQHIIFTPQHADRQLWNDLNVPIFNMPTPKRPRPSDE